MLHFIANIKKEVIVHMGDWLEEQLDLGRSKQLMTFYIYIWRYSCIDENGKFDFNAFRQKMLKFMEHMPWLTSNDYDNVRSATDFMGVEAMFWGIAEREAQEYHYYRRADLDPCGRFTASTLPRTLYVAGMMDGLTGERWCWRKPLAEAKAGAVRFLESDADAVNAIQGIRVIPKHYLDKMTRRITAAEDFDELERTFEQAAGELWDIIDEAAEALFIELEKAAHRPVERPIFSGNIYEYCRDIKDITEEYRHWGSHTDERDYAAGYDEEDIDDCGVGFYDR